MIRKHHPVAGEMFFDVMQRILIAMELENFKRLKGFEQLCAGRNVVCSFSWQDKYVHFFRKLYSQFF